tara:strand:+ start:555 stop:824 length:270 start_codon:yes stop_codon:yes gene_type:complete
MIIPIRCFTCGKVIADKWNAYKDLIEKDSKDSSKKDKKFTLEEITITDKEDPMRYFEKNSQKKSLDKLGIVRMCCVRHFISQVDLVDFI